MGNKIGLIMATRTDRRETDFIVLERITDEYELGGPSGLRPINIERKIEEHMKQKGTSSSDGPVYRKVWFVPIEVPK